MSDKTIIRLGDKSDHGGYMVTAGGKFTNRGLQGCIDGDMHQCPIHNHGTTKVSATSTECKTGGKAMLRSGDKAQCGATLLPTDSNVVAG